MSAGDMSLLTKQSEIQLSKATRGGICIHSDTSIQTKLTVSSEVTKLS